jgi:hypothetical protein
MASAGTYLDSFRVLLFQCLQATRRDQVLVVYDESLGEFFEDLVQVLIESRLQVSFTYLPAAYQQALVEWKDERKDDRVWLPDGLHAAIGEATVILNLLNGYPSTLAVRKAILNRQRVKGSRFAHIPGISSEVLEILSCSPIDQILEQSELVAWGLGEASRARLITCDSQGRPHTLTLDLAGWDNEPLMSPGVIHPGSWGNVPPGETFWCPDALTGSGTVCINGSVPKAPLAEGQEALLHFEGGRLVRWEAGGDGPVSQFLEQAREAARARQDPGWNQFAELGIGLNPAIGHLTGNPLFDEKKAGTIHIAIGDNSGFGFGLRAGIHADLVSLAPTLILDDVEVMSAGALDAGALDRWRRSRRFEPLALGKSAKLILHPENFEGLNGQAMRRLCRADRLGYVRIAEGEEETVVREVVAILQSRDNLPYRALREALDARRQGQGGEPLDVFRLNTALALLAHYRVVEVKS